MARIKAIGELSGGGVEILFDDNIGATSGTLPAQDDSVTVTKSGTCKGTYGLYASSANDIKIYKNGVQQTFTVNVSEPSRYAFAGTFEFSVSAGDIIRRTTAATPAKVFFYGVLYVE